jgi:CRISPR/Cas system-associated exonuclease Cas4 (RecB family)
MKDTNRYSYSRFKSFHNCPRKHYYQYVELIETPESKYTIPGKLFHAAIEAHLNEGDMEPIFAEFETLCKNGKLEMEPDLLESVVYGYLAYYRKEYDAERKLAVELELEEDLEDGDKLVLIVDQVFEKNGHVTIRDMKTTTTKLKYTTDDVKTNQQMLMYIPFVEAKLGVIVDAIQIDEVKLAKLGQVPLNNNGKPTIDKKKLELVTYEDYLGVLKEQGLDDAQEYQYILEHLEQRGHPLFRRTTVQVLDRAIIDSNIQDLQNTYKVIKTTDTKFRNRGPLCNYCEFKQLCNLDMFGPSDTDRKIVMDKMQATKPEGEPND